MPKLISPAGLQGRFRNITSSVRQGTQSSAPSLGLLSQLRGVNRWNPNSYGRAFFCSDSNDVSDPVVEAEGKSAEVAADGAESKASSAIVPTNPRLEDCLTDPKLLAALAERRKRQAPCAGAFLLKNEPGTEPSLSSGSEIEKNLYDLKGKELFNCLHDVGTLSQVNNVKTPFSSPNSTYTTLHSHTFDTPAISQLIAKQHWSKLKTIVKETNPSSLLQHLFNSEAQPDIILSYFKWTQKEFGAIHSVEEFCRLLHLLAWAKNYNKVRALLDDFAKNAQYSNSTILHSLSVLASGGSSNWIIVDVLVWAYVKNGEIDLALEGFHRAGDYGFRLSALSCNPMLISLVKQGRIEVVESVYKEMIRRRIGVNVVTFDVVINGLCKVRKFQKAGDVVEDMKAWGFSPSAITYNTIIDGYCKAGKMYKADSLLKEMVAKKICPNEITFNILIDGFYKDMNVTAARKVFEEMLRQGLQPNVVTYNSLINGLCSNGKLDEALGLQEKILGLGLKLNVVTYNALINGFCKKKMLKEAREMLDDIANQGLAPNAITFNTLIDGYSKAGRMDDALVLRRMMLDWGICPNVSTYNCLIGGFCREGNVKEARELSKEMESNGLKANLVTYNILVGALCKKGEMRKAVRLLDEMIKVGLNPSHLTYNTLIDGYFGEGNTTAAVNMRTLMEKRGRRANIVTYNVLIKGYCKKGKLEEANRLLNEMLEKGLVPNRTTYEVLRDEMMEKGFIPDIDGHLYNVSISS